MPFFIFTYSTLPVWHTISLIIYENDFTLCTDSFDNPLALYIISVSILMGRDILCPILLWWSGWDISSYSISEPAWRLQIHWNQNNSLALLEHFCLKFIYWHGMSIINLFSLIFLLHLFLISLICILHFLPHYFIHISTCSLQLSPPIVQRLLCSIYLILEWCATLFSTIFLVFSCCWHRLYS